MLRDASFALDQALLDELRIADALAARGRRAGGLCTLAALCGLLVAAGWVVEEMLKYTTMVLMASSLNLNYAAGPAASSEGPEVIDVEDARRAIAEHRAQVERLRTKMSSEQAAQRRTGIAWVAVLCLTTLIMLLAALAGMMGAVRARGWQWAVVAVNLLGALCTVGCIIALSTWGGFQPIEDAGVLLREIFWETRHATVWLVRAQGLYALLVAGILIATRHRAGADAAL